MTFTRADLIQRVVDLLGEAFPGEIVTADDAAKIDGYIDGKVAELALRRVIVIADTDRIDEEVFEHLAILVASSCRAVYRQPRDVQAELRAEARLREMQLEPDPGETVRACYF